MVDPYLVAANAVEDVTVRHQAVLQFHGRRYSVWSQVTFPTRSHPRGFHLGPVEYIVSALVWAVTSGERIASGSGWAANPRK